MTTKNLPLWATPDRQNALVRIFLSSGGFCVFGHKPCLIPEHHYYLFSEALIHDWKQIDKEQATAEWERERKAIHSLGERRFPVIGRFNAISMDIYADSQPLYFLGGQAVSGVTLKPFVKVRIASSYVNLFTDLSEAFKQVSKNKRRKATRYGSPLPREVETRIRRLVLEAVRDYMSY
ncbi:hypothetical protein ES703_80094 [subsurface metagenome]